MTKYTLCLLNKNYSSWSIRCLLVARFVQLPVEIHMNYMDDPDWKQKMQKVSPTVKAPSLIVTEDSGKSYIVWESLSILEYLIELYPELLPKNREERSLARSVSAEMHAGFLKIRNVMPYNLRGRKQLSAETLGDQDLQKEIHRIIKIWEECRLKTISKNSSEDEGFLFGKFTVADSMFIHICYRFRTYNIPVENEHAKKYMETIFNWPLCKELEQEAINEDHIVDFFETK